MSDNLKMLNTRYTTRFSCVFMPNCMFPEGIEKIKKIEEFGFQNDSLEEKKPKIEIFELIDEIIKEISEPEFNKKNMILKLNEIKEKLKI